MRKIKFVSLLLLLGLLLNATPGTALAATQSQEPLQALVDCKDEGTDNQVKILAQLIVKEQVSEAARNCYAALSDEGKARVFEAMAMLRGISLEELHKEAQQDMLARKNVGLAAAGDWKQPLERAWIAPVPVVSVSDAWWSGTTCDNDPDIDYIFLFRFSSAVTNPDGLWSFSSHLGVDAMLLWYQIRYGGITGFGNTSSMLGPFVKTTDRPK